MIAVELLCIITMFITQAVTAQGENDSEGSVVLVSNGGNSQGVLKVFTQGKWNVVCYSHDDPGTIPFDSVTNTEAATAACKQLGYYDYFHWGSATNLGFNHDNLSSTAINGIRCPKVHDARTEGEMVLMRCDIPEKLINSSLCNGFVAIICDVGDSKPYSGQVRAFQTERTPPLLEIYFEREWRPLCGQKVTEAAAISACRQMGYTGYSRFTEYPSKNYGLSWKIDHNYMECDSNSYPCFTDCIQPWNNQVGYKAVDSCEGGSADDLYNNYTQYELICQFNKSDEVFYSAGNQFQCLYPSEVTVTETITEISTSTTMLTTIVEVTASCTPSPQLTQSNDVRFYSFVGALSLESLLLVILVIAMIAQCYIIRRRPKNGPPQPNMLVQWWRRNYGAVAQRDD